MQHDGQKLSKNCCVQHVGKYVAFCHGGFAIKPTINIFLDKKWICRDRERKSEKFPLSRPTVFLTLPFHLYYFTEKNFIVKRHGFTIKTRDDQTQKD